MNATSRTSWSRSVQGSRPNTRNSPSKGVRPRIALRAVVLPAPLGPMRPRMRPSSTVRSMPSSAIVEPNALRKPRASMQAMSAFLLSAVGRLGLPPLLRCHAEPADRCRHARPVLGQKLLALRLQQELARAGVDEHAAAATRLDEPLVDEPLVGLEDRDRIQPVLGGDIPHRGERIAFVQNTVQDQRHDAVAKLSVDRLAVVPFAVHLFSVYVVLNEGD